MSVAVLFPDGSVRQVVGALKLERDGFVQCPLNCDPQWKYVWQSGHWVATVRHGQIHAMPKAERKAWWEDIAQLADDAVAAPLDEAGARRSAA